MNDHSQLTVCTTDFQFAGMYDGKEHRCQCDPGDAEWEERVWGGYDLRSSVALCYLCARGILYTTSRWTWLGCSTCRSVNYDIATAIVGEPSPGNQVVPLGRHSLMNQDALTSKANRSAIEEGTAADALAATIKATVRIHDWKIQEAKRLVDRRERRDRIPLVEWLSARPASRGASADALCRYLGDDEIPLIPALEELRVERAEFLDSPETPWFL